MSDVSSVVNHFSSAHEGFLTTLGSTILSGAATVPLTSTSGLTNGNIFVGIIEPGLTKQQTFTGVIDTGGTQITGVKWTRGTNADHSAGVTIVDYVTGTGHNMMTKGILVAHNQDGTHATSLVLVTPKVTTSINDTGGNEIIKTPATASAVNEITVTNAATGNSPSVSATGGDAAINLNLRGKGLAKTVTIGAGATTIYPFDYVASGCVWTADSAGVNRNASMTAGVVVINGNPITVAAVTARTFTASKDVYVDVLDNGDGTGLLVYTDGTTNAASGALASNSIRLAIIVVGAGSIAAAASVNQGQEDRVLPIASSVPYTVTDSLGNLICPRDPHRKSLGYRQILSTVTLVTPTSDTLVTGLTAAVIAPGSRKVKITAYTSGMSGTNTNSTVTLSIWDGTVGSGTQLAIADNSSGTVGADRHSVCCIAVVTPVAGAKTYNVGLKATAGNGAVAAAATAPAFILVEPV